MNSRLVKGSIINLLVLGLIALTFSIAISAALADESTDTFASDNVSVIEQIADAVVSIVDEVVETADEASASDNETADIVEDVVETPSTQIVNPNKSFISAR